MRAGVNVLCPGVLCVWQAGVNHLLVPAERSRGRLMERSRRQQQPTGPAPQLCSECWLWQRIQIIKRSDCRYDWFGDADDSVSVLARGSVSRRRCRAALRWITLTCNITEEPGCESESVGSQVKSLEEPAVSSQRGSPCACGLQQLNTHIKRLSDPHRPSHTHTPKQQEHTPHTLLALRVSPKTGQ